MPIPFRDDNELDELGTAGYLKLEARQWVYEAIPIA